MLTVMVCVHRPNNGVYADCHHVFTDPAVGADTVWERGRGIVSVTLTTALTLASLSARFSAQTSTAFHTKEPFMNGSQSQLQVCCFIMYLLNGK